MVWFTNVPGLVIIVYGLVTNVSGTGLPIIVCGLVNKGDKVGNNFRYVGNQCFRVSNY